MRMMVGAVLAATTLAAGTTHAGEWRTANVDEEWMMIVDTSTIRKAPYSQKKNAWMARLFPRTEEGVDYVMMQVEVDCSAMNMAYMAYYRYGVNGSVIDSDIGSGRARPVIPDTRGHDVFRVICDGSDDVPFNTVREALDIYRDVIANDG